MPSLSLILVYAIHHNIGAFLFLSLAVSICFSPTLPFLKLSIYNTREYTFWGLHSNHVVEINIQVSMGMSEWVTPTHLKVCSRHCLLLVFNVGHRTFATPS